MSHSKPINEVIKEMAKDYTFRGNRLLITIHRHLIGKDDLCLAAIKKLSKKPCKLKAFNETSKSGHEHSHVVCLWPERVKLTAKKKWQQLRELAAPGMSLNPISTDLHFGRALGYETAKKKGGIKSKSVVLCDEIGDWSPDLSYHEQVLNFIQSAPSWKAVVSSRSHGAYIATRMTWAKAAYNCRPLREEEKVHFDTLRPWQASVVSNTKKPTCPRSIHWLWENTGGAGKSDFAAWMGHNLGAALYDGGKHADMTHSYDREKIVVFDLSRTSEGYEPYRSMEAFKRGWFSSPKYDSHTKFFARPQVYVFANRPPSQYDPLTGKPTLSLDMWNIVEIDRDSLALNLPLTSLKERLAENTEPQKMARGCPTNVKTPPGKKGKRRHVSFFQPVRTSSVYQSQKLSEDVRKTENSQKSKERPPVAVTEPSGIQPCRQATFDHSESGQKETAQEKGISRGQVHCPKCDSKGY